jgi:lambda family phage portal protein
MPNVDVDQLPDFFYANHQGSRQASARYNYFDGEKFAGGFGDTRVYQPDYWTLRQRSGQLFRDNLYGRGIIRRLVTNEINTGLTLNSTPAPELIPGLNDEAASTWSEDVEARWKMFSKDPRVCDFQNLHNEGRLQEFIRQEALVDGDILCVQRFNPKTGQSGTQLVRGENVRTPPGQETNGDNGNMIRYGVELDRDGRHVAYHIQQDNEVFERLPATGARTGRPIAWLVYGTDRRFGDVRGEPLISIIMQSLREIDRYRDAAQRKAVINSMLAMYIMKNADKMGTKPLTNAGIRRDSVDVSDPQGERSLNFNSFLPGITLDELQVGEEPKAFGPDGTDINFPNFEAAIIQAIAWACEMPPEILTLQFSNNYSASQAAINEFKIYLNSARNHFSGQYCTPRYHEWLYNELVARRINAPGLLQAWDDPRQYQFVGAWRCSDWTGAIKPSTDIVKQTKGYSEQLDRGLITHEKAAKELNGSSFRDNVRRLARESQQLADAIRPLVELQQPPQQNGTEAPTPNAIGELVADAVSSFMEENTWPGIQSP